MSRLSGRCRFISRCLLVPLAALLVASLLLVGCGGDEDVLGDGLQLTTGGNLSLPEGAVPEDTVIEDRWTEMPLLPDDVQALGEAFEIKASAQPSEPATLRLPLPADADGSAELALLRVESDGTTTFLATEITDDAVVADTPGFSTFVLVELLSGKDLILLGTPTLLTGQRAVYRPWDTEHLSNTSAITWSVTGPAEIVDQGDGYVTLQASSDPGFVSLHYECVDLAEGRRWYGTKFIKTLEEVGLSDGSSAAFAVSVVTKTPIVEEGTGVAVTAGVHGAFEGPITWTWDLDDGDKGGPVTTDETATHFDLPVTSYRYRTTPSTYQISVTAEDASGLTATGYLEISVLPQPYVVAIEGPALVPYVDPFVLEGYTARASGGESPRYTYGFLMQPTGQLERESDVILSTKTFRFEQPGSYLLEVAATDEVDQTTSARWPVTLTGGESLSARILDLADNARPGEQVSATAQVRGGILVVNGKKGSYTLWVDWGDGGPLTVEKEVGAAEDFKPNEAIVYPFTHEYAEAGTYTVRVEAMDATGTSSYDTREIVIGGEGAGVSGDTSDNTAPTAEDINTSTGGSAVAITLKGSDPDGDDLEYLVVSGPSNGTLSGSEPFLTYTPSSGFSGTDSFTYKVSDGQADSQAATVRIDVGGGSWVRSGAPVVNPDGLPLEFYGGGTNPDWFPEARFEGTWVIYRPSETSFSVDDRWVDHGYESYNVTLTADFDPPEPVLAPGESYELSVECSHSGSVEDGNPGIAFEYRTEGGTLVPKDEALGYSPWSGYEGQDVPTKTWSFTAPQGQPGDTLVITAFLWNAAQCSVIWTYEFE